MVFQIEKNTLVCGKINVLGMQIIFLFPLRQQFFRDTVLQYPNCFAFKRT